jgi:preprotein translocase SecF subunit
MSWWPFIRLLPVKTDFRYVKFAGIFATLSILAVLATFVSFATGGFTKNPMQVYEANKNGDLVQAFACTAFNCGVDFKGGAMVTVQKPGAGATLTDEELGALRAALGEMRLGDVQAQNVGDSRQAMLRFEAPEGQDPLAVIDTVKQGLRDRFPGISIQGAEVVGPKVSGELFRSGVIALGLAILLMLVYIAFRFELSYAIGAVIALFHDLILTMGLMSILRIEFTLVSIAALLTVIGYSMNDTVVVYDRMRENRRKYKRMSWGELIDLSLNETLSRTIITGGTALLALGGLMFIGGPTMFAFAFAMIFGIVIGTYSSIYVAAPALLVFGSRKPVQAKAKEEEGAALTP